MKGIVFTSQDLSVCLPQHQRRKVTPVQMLEMHLGIF